MRSRAVSHAEDDRPDVVDVRESPSEEWSQAMKSAEIQSREVPPAAAHSRLPQSYLVIVAVGLAAALAISLGSLAGALVFLVALCAIPLMTRPFLTLNVLIAFSAFDAINTLIPSAVYTVTATKLVGYLMALSLLLHMAVHRTLPRLDAPMILIAALLVLITASAWNAENLELLVTDALRLLQLTILFIAVRQLCTTAKQQRTIAITIVASLSIGAVIALVEGIQAVDRISGVSQNAAILAADLFVGLAMAVALLLTTRRKGVRVLLAACVVLIGLVLSMTETRAAFLALLPAGIFAALVSRRFNGLLAILTVVLMGAFVALGGMNERLAEAAAASDNSTRGHLRTLYAGVKMVEEHPLLGVGLGNFRMHYLRLTNDPLGLPKTAHNTYLSFAAELGLGGLILWSGLVLVSIVALFRAARVARLRDELGHVAWHSALVFALVGTAIMAVFHTLHFSKYLWLLMALAANAKASIPPPAEKDSSARG
ncbi:hypothetical protein GC173_12295 [bacterium]|nr:hypothetical protein [bacterium]